MSDIVDGAVNALNEKMGGAGFDGGVAKFVITDAGSVVIDGNGARAGDDDADVTLSADVETFEAVMAGDLNPTAAFMSGKLTVDGDMGLAMQLGSVLG
ncbi:MAG: SCP2 sterol-binding domain-containing protein [Marinovum sp.]|nr:SCP2 sterol-binding domain-containing protein [Marinovum sp.]